MRSKRWSRGPVVALGLGLSLIAVAVDAPPGPAQDQPPARLLSEPLPAFAPTAMTPELTALAKARFEAARAQFQELWTFYRERRTDDLSVYFWSRLVLESQRDLCPTREAWVLALEEHRDRMLELEALVKRVSRMGFTRKVDVKGVAYYHAEVDYWIARAKAN